MALECCKEPYSWSLPCGVLGDTGNSCWKEPARDEPCSCSISWRILVEELILYVELLGVAGLRVVLVVLVGCVLFVETPLYLKIDWRISPWIFSLLFFGNNSVHRIIILVWMTGSMWIRPYVLLAEEMQIQPLFWHHVELLVNKPLLNVVGAEFRMKQTKYVLCTLKNLF